MPEQTRFQRWYNEHKDEIRERRKARYHSDPEYREAVLKRSREHGAKRVTSGPRWAKAPRRRRAIRHLAPRMFEIEGKSVVCVSIGALAEQANVALSTILGWNRLGTIPPPSHRDSGGHRWYSREYVRKLRSLVARGRRDGWRTKDLKVRAWEAIGGAAHAEAGGEGGHAGRMGA